ncbi:MAG TPA: PEGA domain-containing protein, partial [Burkholderiales bacterium]|nr:PEGA domain-containing protein [Burkholderiales bacterium]
EVYAISSAPSNLRRTVPVPAPRQVMSLPNLRLPKFLKLNPQRWSEALAVNSKLLVAAPLAFTLIVGTGVIARSHRDDARSAEVAAAPSAPAAPRAEAPAARAESVQQEAVTPKTEEPSSTRAKNARAPHRVRDRSATGARLEVAKSGEADAAKTREAAPPRSKDTDTVAAAAPLREATLNIVALPWAEVFVDGTRQGVSPPLRAVLLRPGRHRIELRNGSFPPHVQTVDLRSGTEVSITHRFRR